MLSAAPILLLLLAPLTTAALQSKIDCLSTDATYSLCVVSGTNITVVSNPFPGDELEEECHGHFLEEAFEGTCQPGTTTVKPENEKGRPTTAQRYGYGFLAVFIVSALSLVGILAVPCIHKGIFPYVLALFTALAVGTLFGDAMFHLIPSAFGLHNHGEEEEHSSHDPARRRRSGEDDHSSHEHSDTVQLYQWRAFVAVMVLYGYYLLEVFLHWMTNTFSKKGTVHSKPHGHSHDITFARLPRATRTTDGTLSTVNGPFELEPRPSSRAEQQKSGDTHSGNEDPEEESRISPATGWMVILGDAIHNFADGLAVGAAFSDSLMVGLTTTIAIGCHELPHELGDYAVLLQAGFSRCRALLWNFVSATTAIIGFFVGAAVSTNENARQWIFAVTVGMFLYIALVDLLPTLLPHGRINLKRFICVNVGFLVGIAIMFVLAIFEDKLINAGS